MRWRGISESGRELVKQFCCAGALFLLLHFLFAGLSGKGLSEENFYNSYSKQCVAWLSGRLDLGENYEWLELAVFQGKYYVSFPPFPSYVLLPFAVFCGENTPDTLLTLAIALLGIACGGKIARQFELGFWESVLLPLFLYCGTAVWQITVDGWVWFFAQNLSLTLTLMSFSLALDGKKGGAAFSLCCAVGCRPFQILYAPFLLLLLYRRVEGGSFREKWKGLLLSRAWVWIPSLLLAGSYLLLNFLRFQNPLEFGHSYLPEFTHSPYGQFSLHYVGENIASLFRLPEIDGDSGKWIFPQHDGMNIFLAYPVLVWWFWLALRKAADAVRKKRPISSGWPDHILLALLVLLHLFCLTMHKTMGGWHFGNRYAIDTLPAVFTAVCRLSSGKGGLVSGWDAADGLVFFALLLGGLALGFTGVLSLYAG